MCRRCVAAAGSGRPWNYSPTGPHACQSGCDRLSDVGCSWGCDGPPGFRVNATISAGAGRAARTWRKASLRSAVARRARADGFGRITRVDYLGGSWGRDAGTAACAAYWVPLSLGAGVSEEMLFRGLLQTRLEDEYGTCPGWLMASGLFGAAHLARLDDPEVLLNAGFAAVAGLYLGWRYRAEGYRLDKPVAAGKPEIGEISIPIQIKLLQVLQERVFSPVGSHQEGRFQGRVIAATNRSLEEIRRQRVFRDDSYYRLCSDIIVVPPLRQRIREAPQELDDLLAHTVARMVGAPSPELVGMVKAVVDARLGPDYPWPGNVRELEQCVRRVLLKKDYAGREVLMTSRMLAQTPWTLVQKIDAAEALKESREHQRFLLTSLFLSVLVGLIGLIAAWWHGASVKERAVAEDMRAKSRELAHQSALLQSVMDGTPDLVFIVADQHLDFCNAALGKTIGEKPVALAGKTLSSIFGPAAAHPIESMIKDVQSSGQPASRMIEIEIDEHSGIYYVSAIPIDKGGEKHRVLCICRDMTLEQQSQSKRQSLMNHLVTVLTQVVDMHDPFCADHSGRTAQVAVTLGKALSIDAPTLDALDLAAKLANVGKMFLPRDLLTKHDALTAEEQAMLAGESGPGVQKAVEILVEGS
mgnify:CR=1 FL=1